MTVDLLVKNHALYISIGNTVLLKLIFILFQGSIISKLEREALISDLTVPVQIVRFLLYDYLESPGVDLNNTALIHASFNSSKETVFLIHGWSSHHTAPMAKTLKDAYLSTRDINVIIVDWKDLALSGYQFAKLLAMRVGRLVGSFIKQMMNTYSLDLDKTSIVGYSLGAHIAGVAGRTLGGKLDHITGKFFKLIANKTSTLSLKQLCN